MGVMSIHSYHMKCKSVVVLLCLSLPLFKIYSQHFEGRFSYTNYRVFDNGDTVESSTMNYWIKDHLYKHSGYVIKAPLVDLGTLYADAHKMTRTNINNSGKVERIGMPLDQNETEFVIEPTDSFEDILGYRCQGWEMSDNKTNQIVSTLWVSKDISSASFDQFVELFNYQSTLFPCKGIDGWILKREDYRRPGEIFVTEAIEVKMMKIDISEMVVY